MNKTVISVLIAAVIILVVSMFMLNARKEPLVSQTPADTAVDSLHTTPVQTASETAPLAPEQEMTATGRFIPATSDVDTVSIPGNAEESDAVLPKTHIAWTQELQMRQLLEMDPNQLSKFRSDYQKWIGGKLARHANIELTTDEVDLLTEIFMDGTTDFYRHWQPILKEGLEQPGESRDRLALLNAVDPDMMLMLYAIPARQNEITEVVGSERYEKMRSIINAEFQKWFDSLTNKTSTIQQLK